MTVTVVEKIRSSLNVVNNFFFAISAQLCRVTLQQCWLYLKEQKKEYKKGKMRQNKLRKTLTILELPTTE